MQVCKIGVWVIFCFRQPQQIIGGHAVKLRQLDKGIVADVLEILRNKRLQRNFGFVFDYMDTSALTGQPYLPAMISESSADLYHSR